MPETESLPDSRPLALTPAATVFFLAQFRDARARTLRDSESVDQVIHVLERLGAYFAGGGRGLAAYKPDLIKLAAGSELAKRVPDTHSDVLINVGQLYDLVREARNGAVHEGARARYLARHAVELCLILEDALTGRLAKASDLMVRSPVCAELWQPLALIRQTMLINSFNYLPVRLGDPDRPSWQLVADYAVARYIGSRDQRRRLAEPLEQALAKGLSLEAGKRCRPDTALDELRQTVEPVPRLVFDSEDRLLGIITAFDLL